jgi:hypothetical protein
MNKILKLKNIYIVCFINKNQFFMYLFKETLKSDLEVKFEKFKYI